MGLIPARRSILLLGSGPLSSAIASGLRRARRRFEHCAGLDQAGRHLCHADVLLLADAAAPEPVIAAVAETCRDRPTRMPPLRLILVEETDSGAGAAAAAALPADGPLRVEPLAVDRRGARLLLRRWPMHLGVDPQFGQAVHLVIAGNDATVDALLLEALRAGHYSGPELNVTVLGADRGDMRVCFENAHPQARHFSRVRFLTLDDPRLTDAPPATLVVVLVGPPARGLDIARGLIDRFAREQRVSPPVVLEVDDAEPHGVLADWDGQLYPFQCRREVLSPTVLLDGEDDALARVVHEHYRDTTEAQGRDPSQEAAGRPWPALADSYRDANRRQADHLWAKLAVTDCRAVPLVQVESFAFTPAEVERLAVIEHDRWAADRWLDGWTYAPVRDNVRRHHPQLIPFGELSAPMKDLDRFAVRLIPTLLARSGLGIVRMLIIGCRPASPLPPGRLRPLLKAVLSRLCARYPDRSLVIAGTLADAASPMLARLAIDGPGAGLFLLGDRPVSDVLTGAGGAVGIGHRERLLALLTHAERRIPLPAPGELERWLAARAEVLVHVAAPGEPVPRPQELAAKAVVVDIAGGRLHWGFEY